MSTTDTTNPADTTSPADTTGPADTNSTTSTTTTTATTTTAAGTSTTSVGDPRRDDGAATDGDSTGLVSAAVFVAGALALAAVQARRKTLKR